METIGADEPIAVAVVEAIRQGDLTALDTLLGEHPGLATARLRADDGVSRTLLHIADLNWIPPWENLTPLDAARRSDAGDLVGWLRGRGARSAADPTR